METGVSRPRGIVGQPPRRGISKYPSSDPHRLDPSSIALRNPTTSLAPGKRPSSGPNISIPYFTWPLSGSAEADMVDHPEARPSRCDSREFGIFRQWPRRESHDATRPSKSSGPVSISHGLHGNCKILSAVQTGHTGMALYCSRQPGTVLHGPSTVASISTPYDKATRRNIALIIHYCYVYDASNVENYPW